MITSFIINEIGGIMATMDHQPITRASYEASICARLNRVVEVPFAEVTLDGWAPGIADCHENVNRWVEAHPGCVAVRGWIVHMSFGPLGCGLTAHSVVRTPDGGLIDITPVHAGAPRGGPFVEHQGEEALFFAMKALGVEMRCLKAELDPEEMARFVESPAVDGEEE